MDFLVLWEKMKEWILKMLKEISYIASTCSFTKLPLPFVENKHTLNSLNSSCQNKWVWASFGRRWRPGKPGVLHSMGVSESDLTEQLNRTEFLYFNATPSICPTEKEIWTHKKPQGCACVHNGKPRGHGEKALSPARGLEEATLPRP